MSLQQFPVLPGVAWGIIKAPVMSTRVMTAASGVEYRAQDWSYPRWKFTLPFQFLRQYNAYIEWSTLVGFVLQQAGMFGNFIYDDPFDDTVTNQQIGVGDGTTTVFPLVRTIGGFTEPILYVNTVSSVFKAGVLQTTGYSVTQVGPYGLDSITFVSAPAIGAAITANFTFFFVCRFLQDDPEFNNFMGGNGNGTRWEAKGIMFESVK